MISQASSVSAVAIGDPVAEPPVKRPHVVFLNRSYWPDSEATGQLLTELTTDLTPWFDVTVIAGLPNHVEDEINPTVPGGGEYHGVTIQRVWHSRFSKHSRLGRLANLATFTLSAWRAARSLRRRPDVLVVETDPFFLPLIGRRLQRRFEGCPLICYLQDLYPDIAVAVGKVREGLITRTLRRQLFGVYRQAHKVIVLSRDMQQRCESYGVPRSTLEIVPNWADTESIYPIKTNNEFRREHGLGNQFVVMYSGNMGLAHELDTLLNAAALLRHRTDIEWFFVGEGARRSALEARVRQLQLDRVRFLPYQPRSFLAHSLSAADVHLVSVRPEASACVMPSKLYGIFASGTPTIVLTEPETELHELINDHAVGFTCPSNDDVALAERIQELAADAGLVQTLGHNARRLAEKQFHRRRQTGRFAAILCRILGRPVPALIEERLAAHTPAEASADSHQLNSTNAREPVGN